MLNPATNQATDFITGASQPVDIQVGDDGSLYYLARGTSSVMKVRYTTPRGVSSAHSHRRRLRSRGPFLKAPDWLFTGILEIRILRNKPTDNNADEARIRR
jgi:hypothetical protein